MVRFRKSAIQWGALLALILMGITSATCSAPLETNPGLSTSQKSSENTPHRDTHPQKQDEGEKVASANQSGTSSPESIRRAAEPKPEVSIEKLDGYKTPCEYFVVKSRSYPKAVAAVSLPIDYARDGDRRYPMVIAFGGAGECARAPDRGALAWIHYYKSDEADVALRKGKLAAGDFRDLAGKEEIARFNAALKRHPYLGIILVCPSSPLLFGRKKPEIPAYETYIMEDLIPALKQHYRVDGARIGVDGVSMGGSRSMYYGFKYPETFKSIGSVQGAFGPFMEIYRQLIVRNGALLKKRSIQLVTSDGDMMAGGVKRLRDLLRENGVPCRFLNLSGPHDYVFNQGPGALGLLMFHNEILNYARGPVK